MLSSVLRPAAAYAIALFALAAVIALRWLLDPLLGDTMPLVTLYGAVAAAVWVGGYAPALLASVDVIITTGGTGITTRDSTFEAIDGLLQKRLVGFGELFRMLSYQEIGAAAMLSRATAGLAGRTVLIVLPGSEHAVRLAMDKLVLPELGHVVREARR